MGSEECALAVAEEGGAGPPRSQSQHQVHKNQPLWRLRNVARGSSLRERALERDGGLTEEADRMGVAHTPLPATHPIASRYGRPGELIYPGIGVIDRDAYLMTARKHRLRRQMWEATRTVFLTTQRLLIMDEAMRHQTSLYLRDIYDVNLVPPPESRPELSGEMTIKVAFGADKKRRLVHWDARAADAVLFARTLQEAIAKNEGMQTTKGVQTTKGSALLAPGTTAPHHQHRASETGHGRTQARGDGLRQNPDPLGRDGGRSARGR